MARRPEFARARFALILAAVAATAFLALFCSSASGAPTLSITSPSVSPFITQSSTFEFRAVVSPPNSTVTLNAIPLTPDSGGNVSATISSLTEGPNNLTVVATDWLGENITETRVVILDTVPPSLVVYAPVNGSLTNQTRVDVTGGTESDATVTVNGITVAVDPTGGNFSRLQVPLVDYFALTENLIVVAAVDPAGNGATLMVTVWVDTTPPHVYMDFDPGFMQYFDVNLFAYNNTLENHVPLNITDLNLRGTTDSADAVLTIAGQQVTLAGFSFSRVVVLCEGLNEFVIRSEDAAGNWLEMKFRITTDTIAPPLFLTSPSVPSVRTNQTTLAIAANTGTEANLTVEVRYTGPRGQQVVDPWITVFNATTGLYDLWQGVVIALNIDGNEYIVYVRSIDAAGNYNETWFWYVADVLPPFLEFSGFKSEINEPSLWINGSADIEVTSVEVNGQTFPTTDQQFSVLWTLPAVDGNYTISVTARDAAGNTNTIVGTTHLRIPPPLPTSLGFALNGTGLGPVNSTEVRAGSEVHFSINGSVAAGVEVRWYLDGQLVGKASEVVLNLTEGNHTLQLEVTDGKDTKTAQITVAAHGVQAAPPPPPPTPRGGFLPAAGSAAAVAACAIVVIALRRRR